MRYTKLKICVALWAWAILEWLDYLAGADIALTVVQAFIGGVVGYNLNQLWMRRLRIAALRRLLDEAVEAIPTGPTVH